MLPQAHLTLHSIMSSGKAEAMPPLLEPAWNLWWSLAGECCVCEYVREKENLFADEEEKYPPWGTHPKRDFS